jgi:hypothetical protein
MQDLLVSNLDQSDALANLLSKKGVITDAEFMNIFAGTNHISSVHNPIANDSICEVWT